jgi:hypothetical protein
MGGDHQADARIKLFLGPAAGKGCAAFQAEVPATRFAGEARAARSSGCEAPRAGWSRRPPKKGPLIGDVFFGSVADDPGDGNFLAFGDGFKSLVQVRRERNRRPEGRFRSEFWHRFPAG